jgi:uncharacterized membrane protein YedE/YeeE
MTLVGALIAGLLFGTGLLISGMTDPQRVLGFLDVAGRWDPSLAFTMVGAVAVTLPAFWYVRSRSRDLRGAAVELPNRFLIDRSLVGGSAIFGVGWGLSGICPGPCIVLLTGHSIQSAVFFAGLALGMYVLHFLQRLNGGYFDKSVNRDRK